MADSNRSDPEWAKLIADAEKNISVSDTKYPCPDVGSVEFTKTIDHTLLKLGSTPAQFETLCSEARSSQFATVCVRPEHVEQCAALLSDTDIRVASVIGFHEGTYDTAHKLRETTLSLSNGATELDIVLNYPMLLAGYFSQVFTELSSLRRAAPSPTLLKLILETSQLDRGAIVAACVMAACAGFDFVKTSTGFNGEGAREVDVMLMRACCDWLHNARDGNLGKLDGDGVEGEAKRERVKVKASGGIRSLGDAVRMLEAGASRLGTSGGVGIASEAWGKGKEEGKGGMLDGGY